ncbi:MAG: hypothetical protein H7A40_05835 [Chlamydiales bacterium]|nr:hypothetical protein [Chlamydiales bacterium]
MKITDYISVKPAYEALEAVRGCMPSTETAKSWVVEPIKSAWSKSTGKAVFIAAGFMATLAVAFTAVKAFSWFSSRFSEPRKLNIAIKNCLAIDLARMSNCSKRYKATKNEYKDKTVKECLDSFQKFEKSLTSCQVTPDKSRARNIRQQMKALQDLIREKQAAE